MAEGKFHETVYVTAKEVLDLWVTTHSGRKIGREWGWENTNTSFCPQGERTTQKITLFCPLFALKHIPCRRGRGGALYPTNTCSSSSILWKQVKTWSYCATHRKIHNACPAFPGTTMGDHTNPWNMSDLCKAVGQLRPPPPVKNVLIIFYHAVYARTKAH